MVQRLATESPPEISDRYAVIRRLGAGGEGAVWLARDRQIEDRQVAVKLFEHGRPREAQRNEFAILRRLRHPGLASVHDLGVTASGQLFMVSDFIEGVPLRRWWKGRDLHQALPLLCQLLGTLDFIHRRDVVHGDIKPDNVLIAKSGPKLVDFGLASVLGRRSRVRGGTVGYVAPELLTGGEPSPQSDLYAVGVMLHFMLWQAKPFEGAAAAVAKRQLNEEVVLPKASAPEPLRAAVKQALARDPAQRPSSAAEMLESLEQCGQRPLRHWLVGKGLPEPCFVGRAAAFSVALEALDRVQRAQRMEGLLLVGRHGTGLTRFAEELAATALLKGMRVQRGLSFSPLAQPRYERVPDEPIAEQATFVDHTMKVLCCESREPLLLIVEAADQEMHSLLLSRLSLMVDAPVLVCICAHPGDELDRTLSAQFSRVEIDPLNEGDTNRLVASMLPRGWFSPELGREVFRRAGGNPGLSAEIVRVAIAKALELPHTVDLAELAHEVEVASGDEALTALRLASLGPQERAAATLLSMFRFGASFGLLQQLAPELQRATVASLLMQGIASEAEDGRLIITSRKLARALIGSLSPQERAARAAAMVGDARELGLTPERLALVIYALDETTRHAPLVLQGARVARQALDLSTSALLYQAVVDATPSVVERGPLEMELATLMSAMGRHAEAIARLTSALDQMRGAVKVELACVLAELQLRAGKTADGLNTLERFEEAAGELTGRVAALRAKHLLFLGRHEEAIVAAQPAFDDQSDAIAADARQTAGLCHCYRGRLDEALQVVESAVALAQGCENRLVLARAANSAAIVHQHRLEFDQASANYRTCLQISEQLGHLPFQATFLMNLGSVAQQRGQCGEALERYRQSAEVARRFGGTRELAQVLHNTSWLLTYMGQYDRAWGRLRHAQHLAKTIGWESLVAHGEVVAAEIHLARGELDRTAERLREAARTFSRLKEPLGTQSVALVEIRRELALGAADAALRSALVVAEKAKDLPSIALRARLFAGQAELERSPANAEGALAWLESAEASMVQSGDQNWRIELHLLQARAHEMLGKAASARTHRELAEQEMLRQLHNIPPTMWPAFRAVASRRAPGKGAVVSGRPVEIDERATLEVGRRERGARSANRRRAPRDGIRSLDAPTLVSLLDLVRELNAEQSVAPLMRRIARYALALTGGERAALLRDHDGRLTLELAADVEGNELSAALMAACVVPAREALEEQAAVLGQSAEQGAARQILCVPLISGTRLRGALVVDAPGQDEPFDERAREALWELADHAALALEKNTLLEQSRASAQLDAPPVEEGKPRGKQ